MQSFVLLAAALFAAFCRSQESLTTGPGPVITFPWHPIDQCGPGITCGPEHLKKRVTVYHRNVTSTSTNTIETIAVVTETVYDEVITVINSYVTTEGLCEDTVTIHIPDTTTFTVTVNATTTQQVLEVTTITTTRVHIRPITSTSACLVTNVPIPVPTAFLANLQQALGLEDKEEEEGD